MMLRKRPRQKPSQSDYSDSDDNESAGTFIAANVARQQLPAVDLKRRRRGSPRRITTGSWKTTLASFLLLLCDNSRNYNSQQSMVDAWGGNSGGNATVHTTKKGLQVVGSCSQEDFEVQAVFLVCDSPGAYYRGSSTYRDSTTCIYGDKARLQLQCKCTVARPTISSCSHLYHPSLTAVSLSSSPVCLQL